MPRSKLKRSKNLRASKLKLRNKCGGASGSRSPDGRKLSRIGSNRLTVRKKKKNVVPSRNPSYDGAIKRSLRPSSLAKPTKPASPAGPAGPAKAASPRSRSPSRSPNRSSHSPRRSSSSKSSSASSNSNSSSNNARRRKLFNKITAPGTILGGILEHLNETEIAMLKKVDTKRYITVTEEMKHKGYKFLFDIYNDTEFKKVIKEIKQIDVNKNNYLQTPNKLKEIKKVYKNKTKKNKKERINDLIAIFFKYQYKTITGEDPLDNYMKYLKETSKNQFGEYSEDIERGIAILTLFYGVSDYDIKYIIFSKIKKPEIFLDYISLLNQLCLNQGNITFNPNIGYEFTVRAAQTSKKFNKDGIDKYVELRKEKKDHSQVTDEIKGDHRFLR